MKFRCPKCYHAVNGKSGLIFKCSCGTVTRVADASKLCSGCSCVIRWTSSIVSSLSCPLCQWTLDDIPVSLDDPELDDFFARVYPEEYSKGGSFPFNGNSRHC